MAPLWTSTELRCSIIFPLYTVCIGRLKFCSNWPQSRHSNFHNWLLFEYIAHMLIVLFFCNFPQKGGVAAYFTSDCLIPKVHATQSSNWSADFYNYIQFSQALHLHVLKWRVLQIRKKTAHICICHFNAKHFTQAA